VRLCALGAGAAEHPAQEGGITGYSRSEWGMVAGCQFVCGQSRRRIHQEIEMAKSKARRAIIREWISLAREKRQSVQQASAFAEAALQRHPLPRSRRPPQDVIMVWLRRALGGLRTAQWTNQ
jgi:hypothetical protein